MEAFRQLHGIEEDTLAVEEDQLTELEKITKNTAKAQFIQVRM